MSVSADRIVSRYITAKTDPVTEYLKANSKLLSDLSHGMMEEAKKDKATPFGMRDVREAFESWFMRGAPPPKEPKLIAAFRYLATPKAAKLINQLVTGLAKVLHEEGKSTGLGNVGHAILDFMQ